MITVSSSCSPLRSSSFVSSRGLRRDHARPAGAARRARAACRCQAVMSRSSLPVSSRKTSSRVRRSTRRSSGITPCCGAPGGDGRRAAAGRSARRPGTDRGRARPPCRRRAARSAAGRGRARGGAREAQAALGAAAVSSAGCPGRRPAGVDDHDVVGELLGLVHEVRGEHDGDAVGAQLPTRSQVACRACGSRPAVGSSRKTSSGRPTTAMASASRCCWPPDSRRYACVRRAARPEPLDQRAAGRAGGRAVRGDEAQHLVGAGARVARRRTAASRRSAARSRARRRPGRGRAPGPCPASARR